MAPDVAQFLLGINYFPRCKGIKLWQAFDRGEVRDELAQIAAWGLDAVRIFLTWQDFQPGEAHINHRALDSLDALLTAAADQHLFVLPTLFSGPVDGAFFFPDWCLDPRPVQPAVRFISHDREVRQGALRPIFTDARWRQAQMRLVDELVGFFGNHPAVWGWDLGAWAEQLPLDLSRGAWEDWVGQVAERIGELSPGRVRTWGLGQRAVTRRFPLSLTALAALLDQVAVSVFTFTDPRDPLDLLPARFACDLMRTLGVPAPLIHAIGLPTVAPGLPGVVQPDRVWRWPRWIYLASEEEQSAYIAEALRLAFRQGVAGVFLWCYADYAPALHSEPPYDLAQWTRTCGLLRADGSEKPALAALRQFVDQRAAQTLGPHGAESRMLNLDLERYARDPKREFTRLLQMVRYGEL